MEPVPGLKMVPARRASRASGAPSTPRHPSELLTPRRLSECLASVRRNFDCVLVNASPLWTFSEPLVLAMHGYTILLVLQARTAAGAKGAVAQTVRRLEETGRGA
jgi:Mrp family chromosome partitioning ATPase